jgi:hypothetical protein
MSQQHQNDIEELKKLKSDLETYRRDYNEYSSDKSIPIKEKAPVLANFAKLISSTLERINLIETSLNKEKEKQAAKRSKLIEKEREIEKKSAQPKSMPEQAPGQSKEAQLPVITSRVVSDKVILIIKVDPTKINCLGNSGEINWRIVFDRFTGAATVEFHKVFAGSGLKFPIQIQTCLKMVYYRERNGQIEDTVKSFRIADISNIKNTVNNSEEFKKAATKQLGFLKDQMFNFSEGGSDWMIDSISMYHIRVWEYQPPIISDLSKPTGYVPTPEWLQDRRAIINIKNKDDQCFIKCLYKAIFYDSKNRHNDRDVTEQ